jgi:hypothetical protein
MLYASRPARKFFHARRTAGQLIKKMMSFGQEDDAAVESYKPETGLLQPFQDYK